MKTLENTLVDNSFEDNLIKKLDFQKFCKKLKFFYKKRKDVNLFNRDFYIYKERILNNRTFKDISKDVNRSVDNTRIRFLIMSYYVNLVKNR